MSTSMMTPSPEVASPAPQRGLAAFAGMAATAVALSVGELVAAILGSGNSLIAGVGGWFIDVGAGSLKEFAVRLFGTHDKQALIVGIVLVSLAFGALVGISASRRRANGIAAFVLFGIFAVAVSLLSASGSRIPLLLAGVAAVVAGIGTLLWILGATGAGSAAADSALGRRTVLRSGAAVAAAGAAAIAAGGLRKVRAPADPLGGPQGASALAPLPTAPTPHPIPAGSSLSVNGLSPYVTPNSEFYRIDTALLVPQIDAREWSLRIDGHVDSPLTLSYADLAALATTIEPVTLSCVSNDVGGGLVGNAVWQGVPLATLLDKAGVQAAGTQIMGHSEDGFTAGFPVELARDGRVAMVALSMNGEPLPVEHGFPARIVVAGIYGYVSAVKWLTRIELVGWDEAQGYWIPRGWSKLGPIKTQSRIDVPRSGAKVTAGAVDVGGLAWAPTRGISRVEVQVDGGAWQQAELGTSASANTWVQWRWKWADARPGSHVLRVRATDASGEVQTAEETPVEPNGATGHHTVTVTVTG